MSTFFIISLSLNVIFFFRSAILFPIRVCFCSRYPCLSSSLLVSLKFLSTVALALFLPSLTFLFHFVAAHMCIVAILFLETICIYNSFLLFLGLFKHTDRTSNQHHCRSELQAWAHSVWDHTCDTCTQPPLQHTTNKVTHKTKEKKHSRSKSYAASVTNVSHCGRCDDWNH